MVTSTRQRSVPFAPFAGGGDTTPHTAVGVVWVNIMSARNPKLSQSRHDTLFMTSRQRQHQCISRTVGKRTLRTLGGLWSCRGRSTRVSPYNALGNAAAAASQLLQHSSELQLPQATPSVSTPRCCRRLSLLHSMKRTSVCNWTIMIDRSRTFRIDQSEKVG